MKKIYNLPAGGTTTNVARYARCWRRLGKVIGKATKTQMFGFDPTLSFTNSLRLQPIHAIRLYEAITRKKYTE